MNDTLNIEIIEQLRRLRDAGKSPSELLNHIKQQCPEDSHSVFTLMKYFRKAFNLSLKQVSPIAGWHSGELTDQHVNAFLDEEMPRGK